LTPHDLGPQRAGQPDHPPMPQRPRKTTFANPFFTVLLLASTVFVLTALGYYISLVVHDQAVRNPQQGPGAPSRALADWFDRRGPVALAAEFVVMLLASILAMATDRRFEPKPPAAPKTPGS
jgi:hypothetical protein